MEATNVALYLLTIIISIQAKNSSEESVKYYQNLLQDFLQNVSQWEQPTDSRRFFKVIDEQADAVYHGHYDFIIVGAGVAGSVLSNRLTESGKFMVLLLEAGGHENDFSDVPGFAPYLVRSDFNWGYKTVPQTNCCLGFKNKQCNYPRGRVLGGSSVINLMVYVRGSKQDFDNWGIKNQGWDYKSVLPYFKKSENSTLDYEDPHYHGHHGPLSVETAKYHPQLADTFLKAAKQRGRKVLDYNGRNQDGYSIFQMMTKQGTRCSANKAFVKPAMQRENLEILDHSLGVQILIENKTAYGIEFIRDGKKYKATASREVIISGGAINSPQILMLSGIGPKEQLDRLGISVVGDLPVGMSFHDHQIFPILYFSTNSSTQNQPSMEQHIKHYLDGYGSLTVASAVTGVGFESPIAITKNTRIEYVFNPAAKIEDAASFYLNAMQMTDENWQAISKRLSGKYVWNINPILLHPKSIGSVKLKTKDPLDFPLLDSNFYSDKKDNDMKEMLAIIKDIFKISKTPAFQSIGSQYVSDPLPACLGYKHLSDDYWKCALKQMTYPGLHGVATCKMGPRGDKTAVVDSKLRVHGISRLRVVDASAIPFPVSGNPTAAIYMVGEKASDLIRKEHYDL